MQQDGVVDAFSQRNPSEMVLQIQHIDEPGPMWVDAQKQLFVVQKDGWIAGYRRGQTNFLVRYVDPESGGDIQPACAEIAWGISTSPRTNSAASYLTSISTTSEIRITLPTIPGVPIKV
jgi:hypothetical protein